MTQPLRRTPLVRGRGARSKGGAAEREVVAIAQETGFKDARKTFMSGGQGGGDVTGIPDTHLEVKRQERVCVWEWVGQAERDARPTDVPVVAFRRSRSRWYAVLPLEDYFGQLRELHELRGSA